MNEYEEVETEDLTSGDVVFIAVGIVGICLVVAFIAHIIKKTFKNVHLKLGDKIEIGVETKED